MSAYRRAPAILARVFSSISNQGSAPRTMSSPFIREENQSPYYDPERYYPARVGETIGNRYRIISKLGWGTSSTVWLAKDTTRWAWQSNRYVTLKITNCGKVEQNSAYDEVEMSQQISRLRSNHEGRRYIRLVKESFEIQGRLGNHLCLVFEPLREPLWFLGKHLGCNGVPPAVLKPPLKSLLLGLDCLHSECHIIHTDLKSDNFLLGFEDPNVLESYVRQQESDPAAFKDGSGRPIYQSRPDFGPLDFSSAVSGRVSVPHNHDIQPQPFCAPEVLLKATWTYSADIWNLGIMLWELLADDVLFNGLDPTSNTYSRTTHIAQMIRLLGPPPQQLLERADEGVCSQLFSSRGMILCSFHITSTNCWPRRFQVPESHPIRGVQSSKCHAISP
ncbi:kinase domain protein [Aspergillus sclerotioniger CBS 115572]|uniref:non-specific serine/threonine protein kinase n=1 Tax=Aspergillus sclerotioniger CBS 115572 TaxID=1450535 RepID=A0A317WNB8_9EURO|nr:kinase domain protein [Aspergillus sclerotioniger CBS 115572]PWY87843.1 kinase domain protein [Aspergillus sclerotioniger CBS 115572]